MKKYYLIIFLGLFSSQFYAQKQKDEQGKIALSVVLPQNIDGVQNSQISKIESKIIQITSEYSVAAVGYHQNFVIYPKFMIYDIEIVEGGLQKITVVDCELSLYIKQVDNNMVYSSLSIPLKGSGKSKEEAISNAIRKIPAKDSRYDDFIQKGKNRIIDYYEAKCSDILTQSESLVKMQRYDEAMALLYYVPEQVSCYAMVQEKTIEAYNAYKNQKCSERIQIAKTQLAANNYHEALRSLSAIDPSSLCNTEAQNLIKQAAKNVDAEEKKLWDFELKKYNDSIAMEKYRINAVRDIVVNYYNSKPNTVSYNYIFD